MKILNQQPTVSHQQSSINKVIDLFGYSRLLSFDRDPVTHGPTVEVAHEALLREWARLRGWLNESRGDIRLQRMLAQAAGEWEAAGRDASYFVSGARLAQFEGWAARASVALTPEERAFYEASLAERERRLKEEQARKAREAALEKRTRQVLQALAGVFLVAAIIAGGLAWWANTERGRAATAETDARRQAGILLAQQAENEVQYGNPDRGVLLALEAAENYPYTAQAERALGQAVTLSRAERFLAGHTGSALGAAWSPDGKQIATSSADKTVRIWDVPTGKEVRRLDVKDMALTVAWSPDGNTLLYTTGDRFLYTRGDQGVDVTLWDLKQDKQATIYTAPSYTTTGGIAEALVLAYNANHTAAFSPDGRRLAFITDKTATVWDLAQGKALFELAGHTNLVYSVAWSPDGSRLATASEDNTAQVWDAVDGQALLTLSGHQKAVTMAAWSPDGSRLATASRDGTVIVWEAATGKQIAQMKVDKEVVWDVAWSRDGNRLATANASGLVQVWDSMTGEAAFTLRGHARWALSVAWSPDGRHLVSSSHDTTVYVWKATPGVEQFTLEDPSGTLLGVDWSPDGRQILTAGGTYFEPGVMDGVIQVWDAKSGQRVKVLDRTLNAFDAFFELVFSPDGRHFLTRQDPYPLPTHDQVLIWDMALGDVVNTIPVINRSEGFVRETDWSPDGKRIVAVTTTGLAKVYDAFTGEELVSFTGHPAGNFLQDVAWSPDGKWIASAAGGGDGENMVRIWDAQTGLERMKLEGHEDAVNWVEWSPSGDRLCTASGDLEAGGSDNTIRIWDAQIGKQQLVISGHTAAVWTCGWSPNGSRLFSASADGTARIWDATTGAELLRLDAPTPWYLYAVWSPDDRYLTVVGDSQPGRVWRVWQSTQELIRRFPKYIKL
jgi:WD40 repeat protein